MRLTARISIDIDARDPVATLGHEKILEGIFSTVKDRYPQASLEYRQSDAAQPRTPPLRHYTGRMCEYDD